MSNLFIWVIYFNTKDYPQKYVTRKFLNETPTTEVFTENTLDEIRERIPVGLFRLDRHPQDDPVIVETWI